MLPSTDLNSSLGAAWLSNWTYRGMELSTRAFTKNLSPTWHRKNYDLILIMLLWIIKKILDLPRLVTNGGTEEYKQIFNLSENIDYTSFTISILGESASIMLTHNQSWQGNSGYIVDVDHLNVTTKKYELRLRRCEEINGNCETVISKVIYTMIFSVHIY